MRLLLVSVLVLVLGSLGVGVVWSLANPKVSSLRAFDPARTERVSDRNCVTEATVLG